MPLPYKPEDLETIQELSVPELNQLVNRYKQGHPELLDNILKQFHPLILKYVRIIKGDKSPELINYDTIQFLALFLPKQDKNYNAAMGVIDYLGRAAAHLEDEDLYHDIVLLLMECLEKYSQDCQVDSLGYLITRLRWKLRDYLKWEVIRNPYDCYSDQRVEGWADLPTFPGGRVEDQDPDGVMEDLLLTVEPQEYSGLSEMTLAWVQHTDDPLFRELSTYERYLLYLYWKEDLSFEEIAEVLKRDKDAVWRHHTGLMKELTEMANFCRKCFDSPCRCKKGGVAIAAPEN